MEWLSAVVPVVLSAGLSAGGSFFATWAAIRVELRYLRRDVDRANGRLDAIQGVAA